MKIVVRVKDVELLVNDKDSGSVIKHISGNEEVHKTIKIMVEECIKILKERNI